MKIERIDENSIRCTLTSMDLSSRNLNIKDMAYGSAGARKLFAEMMQLASDEVGFENDGTPLMIEAIPMPGGSLQLIITKVDDPEELDTRFSRFSSDSLASSGLLAQLATEILEGAQGFIKQLQATSKEETTPSQATDSEKCRIFGFDSIDKAIEASSNVCGIFHGTSAFYKNPASGKYYLVIHCDETTDSESFSKVCNILAEYGSKINGEALSEAYYEEHYEHLIKTNAVTNLAKI